MKQMKMKQIKRQQKNKTNKLAQAGMNIVNDNV